LVGHLMAQGLAQGRSPPSSATPPLPHAIRSGGLLFQLFAAGPCHGEVPKRDTLPTVS
jgi:hypothetical protein